VVGARYAMQSSNAYAGGSQVDMQEAAKYIVSEYLHYVRLETFDVGVMSC